MLRQRSGTPSPLATLNHRDIRQLTKETKPFVFDGRRGPALKCCRIKESFYRRSAVPPIRQDPYHPGSLTTSDRPQGNTDDNLLTSGPSEPPDHHHVHIHTTWGDMGGGVAPLADVMF